MTGSPPSTRIEESSACISSSGDANIMQTDSEVLSKQMSNRPLRLSLSLFCEGDSGTELSSSRSSSLLRFRRFKVSEGNLQEDSRDSFDLIHTCSTTVNYDDNLFGLVHRLPTTQLKHLDTDFATKIFALEERRMRRTSSFCASRFDQDLQSMLSKCSKPCSTGSCQEMKKVKFQQVIIREYPIIVGDNPSVNGGPPLTIDWHYDTETPVDFEVYEEAREQGGGRRNMKSMALNKFHRESILRNLGFSMADRLRAAKEATIIRNKRRANNSSIMLKHQKHLESMENAWRNLKNVLSVGRIKREEMEYLVKYAPSLQTGRTYK